MRVTWEIGDGYAGKSRPQYTTIDDDELMEIESKEEREQYISDCIQEDFADRIGWSIRSIEK